jgi:hypothetical protein
LKLEALLFDRIILTPIDSFAYFEFPKDVILKRRSLIQWLIEQNVISEIRIDRNTNAFEEERKYIWPITFELCKMLAQAAQAQAGKLAPSNERQVVEVFQSLFSLDEIARLNLLKSLAPSIEQYRHMVKLFSEFAARTLSAQIREINASDAYPILPTLSRSPTPNAATKNDVVQIVLKAMPTPDESVSWEQIIEYRNDPDSAGKFWGLRNWMNEVAKSSLSATEIEDKLEYLMYQYQQHINLHKLKTNTGTLETVIVTGAEILENLMKVNWGKIAKGLFALKHRQISLLECELNAPGKEVAYIIKARNIFS